MNTYIIFSIVNCFNLLLFLHCPNGVFSTLRCCDMTESNNVCSNECRLGYENMELRQQYKHLAQLNQVCPTSLTRFWNCINNTYSVMNTASRWEGRVCCNRAWSTACRSACQKGRSRAHISDSCPLRSEQSFYTCVKRQETSVKCCGAVTSADCRAICKAIFVQDSFSITATQNSTLVQLCPVQVTRCVEEYTRLSQPDDPAKSLPCCDESENLTCRDHCKSTLADMHDEDEIMMSLIEHCGIPMIMSENDGLWRCFLQNSDSNNLVGGNERNEPSGTIEVAGMDGAKLHCCSRAAKTKCRNLCAKTNGRSFSANWQQFETECRFSPNEVELTKCLDEVSEPCKLGCSGMDFCANFNNRPTEMFRSCSKDAERIAEITFERWAEGFINLPLMDQIPVKNINTCHPEWWRVIACALQIKPCHAKHSVTRICYHDCVRVLGECLDRSVLPTDVTHTTLCQRLAPVEGEDEEHCIKLGDYLSETEQKPEHLEVSHPCIPNPCNSTQICEIRRSPCVDTQECSPFICKAGCQLGEVSPFYAPTETFVNLPLANSLHCNRICLCGNNGLLHQCQELNCAEPTDCHMGGSGRIHIHDTLFQLDCNECMCFNDEVLCTHHECYTKHINSNKGYTGLPCNCNTQYIPVCAQNGHTYWNFCLAKCAPFSNGKFKLGECTTQNPCNSNSCTRNEICLPYRQKCLHTDDCNQFKCIERADTCDERIIEPVCDTNGMEHRNPCLLLQSGNQIAYWGHCKMGCNLESGLVCGIDRNTYANECHAWGHGVIIDYVGECFVTPALVGKIHEAEYQCEGVICPILSTEDFCSPIKPIGVCCYVCASEIRVLYSRKIIESVIDTGLGVIYAVHDIAKHLSNQLSTAECEVFAYISIEQDLVIVVTAVTKFPTPIQVLACKLEAEKLTELIDSRASSIQTIAITSPLLTAKIRQPGTLPYLQSSLQSSGTTTFKSNVFSSESFPYTILISLVLSVITNVDYFNFYYL